MTMPSFNQTSNFSMFDLDGMRISSICFQCVDGPHGEVAHEKKGDDLTTRFAFDQFSTIGKSTMRKEKAGQDGNRNRFRQIKI